jgi:IPT/TIG domain
VTTRAGTSKITAADHYTYAAPRPAVGAVSPDSGATAGGTTVTIAGTGLAGATGVRFGAVPAAVTADSSTQITVDTPPGTGTVTVIVTTPAGTSAITGASHYAYTTRPKLTQSISFTAPQSGTPGGSAALSVTGGGSRNPVVLSVDPSSGPGVCTVSGSTVTYTAAGTCVIDANQAGNGKYAAAPQVQRTITVNAIPQSISFTAPASGTLGGSARLSATGGGSGNPVMFSAGSPGVCTLSGTTVTYTAVGRCVIDANQAGNASYADAPQVQRTITVGKMPQSISLTAPASGTVRGSANLSATGGGSGNPVVFSAGSPRVCTVSGSTVTYTAAGRCVIDANQAGNGTYAAARQVQRAIKVGKIPQSISFIAPPQGTVGSSANLWPTGGGSGNPVVLSVPSSSASICYVRGNTVTYALPGSCVIDANQAGNGTYAAARQVQQTITVVEPPQYYGPGS